MTTYKPSAAVPLRMDGEAFLDRLRANHDTELSRLGSSKALYALTGGEMEETTVRAAAATDAAAAAETFGAWADDADGAAAETFAAAAETAAEQRDAVADGAAVGEPRPLYETLREFADTPERAGGLVARHVVVEAYVGQFVGFFVGNADPTAANEFRDLRAGVEDELDAALDLLETVCTSDAEWERASDAAAAVLSAAYDDYVETLEGMGVKPKNVC